jgi:zinc/manganese transport system substrate-binding protein
VLALLLPAGAAAAAADKLPVVASFSILADIARAVGGDRVAVKSLVPPDGDPHVYEPTPEDSRAIARARLVVENGLGLEGWIDRLVRASGYQGAIVVASAGIEVARNGAVDPHAWQDPRNGVRYARAIAAALAQADPAGAASYRANADAYAKELVATDVWIRQQIDGVPPDKRKLITTHDAFGYFARAYGVDIRAAEGVSTDTEPSARDIALLIRQIRDERIKALFVETITDRRILDQIARDTGAVIGGTVYSDALSPPGGPADTYLRMFRHNVTLFVAAMAKN